MSKKRKFKTTHGLKIDTRLLMVAIGGVAGFYRTTELTVDFMVQAITIGEHLVDSIEWFSEIARSLQLVGVRVLSNKRLEATELLSRILALR